MIMLVDIDALTLAFREFAEKLEELGRSRSLDIRAVHEEIFDAMHRV